MKLKPLQIGSLTVSRPIILAPMAGITNLPFRTLCRELEIKYTNNISGLYICEMITARALIERNPNTLHLLSFGSDEFPRSMQLYTVDPTTTYTAVKMIVDENLADHIDMNFGCPVPKVTRKGGGAALPYKRVLFRNIITAAVKAATGSKIPITVKFRIGIDANHKTHLEAGKIAADCGAAAITLHARTAAQRYAGVADWDEIAQLKSTINNIPVLGNGDVFNSAAAINMLNHTNCDGIVIGRGCLGRPWLFAEIAAALSETNTFSAPSLGDITQIMIRHAELLIDFYGDDKGIRDLRKHISWYLYGFPVGSNFRKQLALVTTLKELKNILSQLPNEAPFPQVGYSARGRKGSAAKVILPENWLLDPDADLVPTEAEIMHSGG